MLPYIDIHTHNLSDKPSSYSVLSQNPEDEIANYQHVFYSAGIHPWRISCTDIASSLQKLELLAANSRLIAIGEIGLDKIIDTPLSIQKDLFEQQLQLAEKYHIPAIIHCVKSFSELIQIRKKSTYKLPWIIHGFVKNQQIAKDLIELGCYISFGKTLLKNYNSFFSPYLPIIYSWKPMIVILKLKNYMRKRPI
ncbi:TatD family hydrolase [Labilibaculum sp.]|uniref:TatD family hydrolase n=1 Tax=Labilibaculum sp. TaxID=2060723 RepID=UPI003563809E